MRDWRPTATLAALGRRAELLMAVRQFFAARGVMEVETPLLASAPVTDPNIDAIAATDPLSGDHPLYLQTSPEFAMKRLLAAGSGPIYQLCKAFRRGERGGRHNPEFSMLEWYRPDMPLPALMDEVVALINTLIGERPRRDVSYRQAFIEHAGLDPFTASVDALRDCAAGHLELNFDSDDRDMWLQLLMSTVVEAAFDPEELTLVYDFPASQAALAKVENGRDGLALARRFEAFSGGLELANGYDELRDASELLRRIRRDHEQRKTAGQELPPIDRYLLGAMGAGLPPCSGVAMGFDRLVMLSLGVERIDEVIAFPLERV